MKQNLTGEKADVSLKCVFIREESGAGWPSLAGDL
jgi:hypothetical protein